MPATIQPTRYYPARTISGVDFPDGYFTNHRAAPIQEQAFNLRQTGMTYPVIANILGFQSWDQAQAAVRAYARRNGVAERRSFTTDNSPVGLEFVTNRRFGVELEYNGDYRTVGQTALARALQNAGLRAESEHYNHATVSYWKCTTDATVSGGECVSPILRGDAGWDEMRTAMRTITAIGGTVGRNCGTHVHHDITDFSTAEQMRTLVDNLEHAQDAIMLFVPRSRWTGGWCGKLSDYEWTNLRTAIANGTLMPNRDRSARSGRCPVDRYRAFNFNATVSYGTVEFRAHGGTLNAAKMRPWIAVGQAVIEFSRTGHTFGGRQSVESMLDTLVAARVLTRRMATKFLARCQSVNSALTARLALEVSPVVAA